MYGLPKDTDLTFLVRTKLEHVEVTEYQAQLHFTGDVCISIEGDCLIDNGPVDYETLRSLVGKTVFGVTIQDEGRLNLIFHDGQRLSILDSNDQYESYQITAPGVTIVV
jgi:hypothetical protein